MNNSWDETRFGPSQYYRSLLSRRRRIPCRGEMLSVAMKATIANAITKALLVSAYNRQRFDPNRLLTFCTVNKRRCRLCNLCQLSMTCRLPRRGRVVFATRQSLVGNTCVLNDKDGITALSQKDSTSAVSSNFKLIGLHSSFGRTCEKTG